MRTNAAPEAFVKQGNYRAPGRFHSLDVLRGMAALGTVFWHWQHFFYTGTFPRTVDSSRLPLSDWISILYQKGWLAVDLFFSLSGFVFYWLYSRKVAEGAITPGRFALLRFSRLYPLHFATLLIVASGQIWIASAQGSHFVFPNNDIKHFLLNLLFISSWGIEYGHSFNGPVWSVSVEVFLYAMFFVCCRLLPVRALALAAIAVIGFAFVTRYYDPLGRGIGSFFWGGCVFLAYRRTLESGNVARAAKWAAYLAGGAWFLTIFGDLTNACLAQLSLRDIPFLGHLDPYFQRAILKLPQIWPTAVLFPLTILSLALLETWKGSLGRRIAIVGEVSYSSYLLHFPLQLLVVALAPRLNIDISTYYSPWFMAAFFFVLILLSLGSYRYFEIPVQQFLRRGRSAAGAGQAHP